MDGWVGCRDETLVLADLLVGRERDVEGSAGRVGLRKGCWGGAGLREQGHLREDTVVAALRMDMDSYRQREAHRSDGSVSCPNREVRVQYARYCLTVYQVPLSIQLGHASWT